MLSQSIEQVIHAYGSRFGDEIAGLSELELLIKTGVDVTSRKEFRGHVTCGAVLFAFGSSVLTVRHRVINEWFLPGGHLEHSDRCLRDAAIRELMEEAHVDRADILPFHTWLDEEPIDIDRHEIPANPRRDEPVHQHWDFRFAFRLSSRTNKMPPSENAAWRYADINALPPKLTDRLRDKLRQLVQPTV